MTVLMTAYVVITIAFFVGYILAWVHFEDKIKKINNFNLTKEDFDFLIELQDEMITQDHVSQASPRFWVVATDKHQELGTEDNYDGVQLYSSDAADIVCDGDMCSIVEYVTNSYSEELEEENIVFVDQCSHYLAKFGEDEEETFYDSEELLDFLKEHDVISDDYELTYYRYVHRNYPNTMFLTNRSCKEHIKANYYHYNDDAHSYAMTAWRSPEVEKLWDILDKVNWEGLKEDIYGPDEE